MPTATLPENEKQRLEAVHGLGILDTPPEERFDRIARLAQEVFDLPVALITVLDSDRQWFKSHQGLDACETPRGISFCAHAILGRGVFVVEDASKDPRFSENPLVKEGSKVRFYAGAPLRLKTGEAVGTLCVLGKEPRQFSPRERNTLADLGLMAVTELENVRLGAAAAVTVQTHLNFNGNCAEAFAFYSTALGGKIGFAMTWGESPMKDKMPPEWGKKIIHAALVVGAQTIIGADSPAGSFSTPQGFAVALDYTEPKEAERVFAALSAGGKVTMPLQETFWAVRFGMCTDKFGTPWMVNCGKPQ